MRQLFGIALLGAGLLLLGCPRGQAGKGEALARVGSHYLYPGDLAKALAERSPLQDSVTYLQTLVSSWVRQQVLLEQAEQNLSPEQKNKEKQVEEFRNSLLIYEYQRQLVEQKLDTAVTAAQISEYFAKNKADFELKQNLVRLRYVKTALRSKQIPLFRQLIRSETDADLARLEEQCRKEANNFFLNDRVWLNFRDVLKEIPIRTYNEEDFLRNNSYAEVKDGDFLYLVRISAYRIRNSESAPELESERIREMIIHARKVKLIREMEQQVLKDAELHGKIEVY